MKKRKPEPPKQTKFEMMDRLLFLYGSALIDQERFQSDMVKRGFTQDDIDEWCKQYYAKDQSDADRG